MKKLISRIAAVLTAVLAACSCDLDLVDTYTFTYGVEYGVFDKDGKGQKVQAIEDFFQERVDIKEFSFVYTGPQGDAIKAAEDYYAKAYEKLRLEETAIMALLPGANPIEQDFIHFFMYMSSAGSKGSGIVFHTYWIQDLKPGEEGGSAQES